MTTLSVRVNKIKRETEDIASFELMLTTGAPMPSFTPGSHIDVHIGPNLIRQYSLCNGPGDLSRYLIAVKREPASRGGSSALHERIKEGDLLTISVPKNNFPLAHGAKHHLLLGAGIGITPMLSMAQHLLADGIPFDMKYFSRSIAHTAFHEILSGPRFESRVEFHYALDVEGIRAYLARLLGERQMDAHIYLCGPRPFMDLVESMAAAATWPSDSVHLEHFSADLVALSGPKSKFTVKLEKRGRSFVIPEDKSICQILAEAGIVIPTSCEQGVCGTCVTGVLAGIPDHRDVFLLDNERNSGDKICPCVSRSLSDMLVLDL